LSSSKRTLGFSVAFGAVFSTCSVSMSERNRLLGYLVFQNLGSLWGMRLRSENSRLNSGGASSPSTFLLTTRRKKYDR
jgi:hypothetical protein